MSDARSRALVGPVNVIARSSSFAERYAAKFLMPDQAYMRLIMRATAVGKPWDTPEAEIARAEAQEQILPFKVFSLEDYDRINGHSFGAPMPPQVRRHIHDVKAEFPNVEVRVRAHPIDDPVIEYMLDGESILGKAWLRTGDKVRVVYPTAMQEFVRKWRFW